MYANTNISEKRSRVLRFQKEIGDLPDDSNDIFKRNMLDRYVDSLDESFCNGRCGVLNKFCYAEFFRFYYIVPSANENDWQSMELKDELLEVNSPATHYPNVISLMSSKEKMKFRKLPSVLRYFTPNKNRDYESYAHHLLLLFYPFRDELDLKVAIPPSYTNKIAEPGVIDIINTNRALTEPFSDAVDEALLQYSQTEMNISEATEQIENDEMQNICLNETFDQSTQNHIKIDVSIPQPYSLVTDDEINTNIQSLNVQQRQVFDFVYSWAKIYLGLVELVNLT